MSSDSKHTKQANKVLKSLDANIVKAMAVSRVAGSGSRMRNAPGSMLEVLRAISSTPSNSPRRETRREKRRQSGTDSKTSGGNFGFRDKQTAMPISVGHTLSLRTGMTDLKGHVVCYKAGVIAVAGAASACGLAGQVYFLLTDGGTNSSYGPNVILPGDALWGQNYLKDISKHYARRRYKRIVISIVPSGPGASSISDITINFGARRGSDQVVALQSATASPSGPGVLPSDIQSLEGNRQFPVYCAQSFDVTKYIANGSGANQNEFSGDESTYNFGSLLSPLQYYIGGTFAGTPLSVSNLKVADVLIEIEWDLLDFVGNFVAAIPAKPKPDRTVVAGVSQELAPYLVRSDFDEKERYTPQRSSSLGPAVALKRQ